MGQVENMTIYIWNSLSNQANGAQEERFKGKKRMDFRKTVTSAFGNREACTNSTLAIKSYICKLPSKNVNDLSKTKEADKYLNKGSW